MQVGYRFWLMRPGSERPLHELTAYEAHARPISVRAVGQAFGVLRHSGWQRYARRERRVAWCTVAHQARIALPFPLNFSVPVGVKP